MVNGEMIPSLVEIGKKFNVNKLFIMVQDVAHARAGGELIAKIMAEKGWTVHRQTGNLSHRDHGFLHGSA